MSTFSTIPLHLGSAVSTFCLSENASRGKHYRNDYEQVKLLPKGKRVVSINPRKEDDKEKTQEAETSTEEEAYKSDKKHLKRGLQLENILIIPIAWEKHQNNLAVCVTCKLIKLI